MNTATPPTGIRPKKFASACLLGILVLLFTQCVSAKPLYVVGDTVFADVTNIKTYDVFLNGTITYRTENMVRARCRGPADLAFTPDGRYMFTVSAGSAWVQAVDTVTMTAVEEAFVSGTLEDFSGVAFDHVRNLVYSVDMGQDVLYVHHWDDVSMSLTLAENGRITLPGTSTVDLALDHSNDLLFVSNGTQQVHVYSPGDWSLVKTLTLGRNVERIDIDERNQLLYAGTQVSGNPYLLQYDLLTTMEKTREIRDHHGRVMGIAVDDSSSLIYVATLNAFYVEGSNQVDVFNGELLSIDQAQINGFIASLGLPVEGISHSPLTITKHILNGTVQLGGVHYARPGDIITYEICFENTSPGPVGNVQVIDTLPAQVDYLGADVFSIDGDMQGSYDPVNHTYQINLQTLNPGILRCAFITVKLREDTQLGVEVINRVTVDSIQTAPVEVQAKFTSWAGTPSEFIPLQITKQVFTGAQPNPVGGLPIVVPGDILIYSIIVENPASNQTVTDVSIVDLLPQGVTYISAIDVNGLSGAYNPDLHSVIWFYPSLGPGQRITVELGVEVRSDAQSGIITNKASVTGNEVPESWAADVDVLVDNPVAPEPAGAQLTVYASDRAGGAYTDQLLAVLILAPQINLGDVDGHTLLTLEPGGTQASNQILYVGNSGQVKFRAYFDKTAMVNHITSQGLTQVTLTVTGRLVNGESFSGETTVPVTPSLTLQN